MAKGDTSADDDLLSDAKEAFADCEEAESENRIDALDDLRFAKLGEQWPETIRQQRIKEGKPCLTIPRLNAFIRQVVNEARQNRPAINVHPVDSDADVQTADIFNGLIRNIERTSKADVAYDTAVDSAVSNGFGYFRINTEYADDESFDIDLRIERIANPFSVYGDYLSTASDSSDWNQAFVTETISKTAFKAKYKGAEEVNWEESGYNKLLGSSWMDGEALVIAEWWRRERVKSAILKLSDGSVVDAKLYAQNKDFLDAQGVTVLGERQAMSHKVTQCVMTGAEVLEKNGWAGKYIPIVPVYGDEVNVEGKRYFKSLIRDAKDSQRMLNYFRSASAELVTITPRVPFIGKKGTFKSDAKKWATVNSANHAYIEYDGDAPARQPIDSGRAIGAIQEASNAQDDMKAIIGLYDPSLGISDNAQSGKAIIAQQAQGNASNFHYLDNLNRGVEHGGRIMVDLIPTVYTPGRIIRILGHDGKAASITLGGPMPVKGPNGQMTQPQMDQAALSALPVSAICDMSRGRYDLSVETGPSNATKREAVTQAITAIIEAYPEAAPILGDLAVKNMDIPEAEAEIIAKRLHAMLPPQVLAAEGGANGAPQDPMQHPQVQAIMQQGQQVIQQQGQALQQTQQQLAATEQALAQAKTANGLKDRELTIKAYEAQTDRLRAVGEATAIPEPATTVQ